MKKNAAFPKALLACLIGVLLAGAVSREDFDDRAETVAQIDLFLERGVDAGPNLDLRKFRSEALETIYLRSFEPTAIGDRKSALYFYHDRIVLLDAAETDGLPRDARRLLLFHETLGANGHADFQYQTTTSLYALARANRPLPISRSIESVLVHPEWSAFAGGGAGAGVKGGGDATSLALKIALVDGLFDLRAELGKLEFTKLLDRAIDVRVEPTDVPLPGGIRIGRGYDPASLRGLAGERPSIWWSRATLVAAERAELVRIGESNPEKTSFARRFAAFVRGQGGADL